MFFINYQIFCTGLRTRSVLSSSCALAHVTDVVGKFCLYAVNFESLRHLRFETGHHDVDGTKDDDSAVDHLAADFALGISLDDDFSAFGMGQTWTSALPLMIISPPVMYMPMSLPAFPFTRILPPDIPRQSPRYAAPR